MSAGGGCEAAVTARARCGCVKPKECGDLRNSRTYRLWLKGSVHKSYVKPAIFYGSEAWCMKENEQRRSMVRAMCGEQVNDGKRSKDLMLMLDLKETTDHLLWSCDERRGWSYLENDIVLRRLRSKEEREAEEDMEKAG